MHEQKLGGTLPEPELAERGPTLLCPVSVSYPGTSGRVDFSPAP